ncbi:uncharacterized protein LOC131692717 [Topomyia yanbarensis]|uniref:uncharacterized protein LOC131692717 n=1 Tax=Topomyia yanbarensis TaxID=2498891 RepID=UPI00273BC108|nr:uncharacterized protein LOC131692717 [Topomyia yanbarensis]
MKCKAYFCGRSKQKHPELRYYRFPKDTAIRRKWIRFCVRHEDEIPFFEIKASSRLCSAHFPDGKANQDKTINIPMRIEALDGLSETELFENDSALGNDNKELKIEIIRLRDEVYNQKKVVARWKRKYHRLKAQQKHIMGKNNARKLFREDQMQLLSGEVTKVKKWSTDTILECDEIRRACPGGYDRLIEKGFPFPSKRTLLRQISLIARGEDDHTYTQKLEFSPDTESNWQELE